MVTTREGSAESGVVVAIRRLILFLLLQRYYVRGFMSGGDQGLSTAASIAGRHHSHYGPE